MAEEILRVKEFNGTNFQYWKMQMEDYFYQKDLHFPLEGKKLANFNDDEWGLLDRKALRAMRLCLSSSVAFNISKETSKKGVMDALKNMYEKPSTSNKVHLIKKLFNLKMNEGGNIQDHVNNFNSVKSQLDLVKIYFDDEIKALFLLCSLPESWNTFVMVVRNISSNSKIVLDEVISTILSEDIRRKSSGEYSTSSSTLTTETRGISRERGRGISRGRSRCRSKSQSSRG